MDSQQLMQIRRKVSQTIVEQQLSLQTQQVWQQQIAQWQATFSPHSGWPDIHLADAVHDGQVIHTYLQRVLVLACQYNHQRCLKARSIAEQALEYWYQSNLTNWNWWWNQIGKQRFQGPIALLFNDGFSQALRKKLIEDLPNKVSMTGANRVDLANGVAYRGLLESDETLFAKAIKAIAETIAITQEEGIQVDFSYHQHGPQLQNGGYGESFLNVALPWAYVCAETRFRFSSEQQRLLLDYYLQGSVWMTRTGRWDYNACGRAIAKPDLEKPHCRIMLMTQAKMLLALFPDYRLQLQSHLEHLQGHEYPFAGFKHFWRSDYSVMANNKFAVSVKANSRRIKPIETGNQENLLGFWLGFGSMNISVTGSEYHDIYSYWDWAKIPGVTCPQIAMPAHEWGQIEQQTDWTGGVSNGRWGISSFELDVKQTQGLKSWFFYDGAIVALGTGICSEHPQPVMTTINQCHHYFPVCVNGADLKVESTIVKAKNWLHHANVGYVLGDVNAHLHTHIQHGCWQRINAHLNEETMSGRVFSLSIDHGLQPQNACYEYTLLPGASLSETKRYVAQPYIKVLANSPVLQAVVYRDNIGCVFRRAGHIEIPGTDTERGYTLEVDTPCLLLCERKYTGFQLAISTPGRGERIKLVMNRKGKSHHMEIETLDHPDRLGESFVFHLNID
ncbi:polysaccharide lyase 8 family protein [Vibrio sp. YIC-376]|uniref:polysaccharide lyase 8 family protein n=1 Tax=Vibrio sp. YIC-376 TaxID=3136162 RepID=UPI00402AA561